MSSDQQYPYDPQRAQYPQHPQHPHAPAHPHAYPQAGQAPQGPYGDAEVAEVAQTWEGQTWDTQYQPVVGHPQAAAYPQQQMSQAPQTPQMPQPPQSPDMQATAYMAPVRAHQPQASQAPQAPQASQVPQAPDMQATAYMAPVQAHQPPAPQAPQAPDAQATAYMAPVQAHQPPAPQQAYPSPATGGHPLPPEVTRAPYEAQAQAQAHAQAPAQGHTASHAPAHAGAPAPAGPDAGPAYSSPTTSGDTRITDAQRARAEGRSPIIDPGMRPAAITAGLGVLLAGGAALGSYGLLVPLVLLQALTAAGWFRLNGMWPARQGIALAFLGGVVADAALLAAGREHAAGAITGTLGVWVLLTVVLQLRSHADPDERMYGLMATVASAALAVLATGYLGAESDAVVAGALAVAAGTLARAVPLPGPVSAVVALLGAAAGGLAGGAFTGLGASSGALLGLGAGVCALIGLRAAAYDYPSRFVHMTAGVALPLTAAVPAVYLLGRVLA
ncbi:hypothetical protein [Streptomyces laurentii]|uniref:hypothetical protein n=1 Tax=Streptomyces laurentii TaxID=39478 RepID=UPI0036CCFE56